MRDDRCQKGISTKGRYNACFNHYLYGGIQPDCLSDRFDIRIFHRFSLIRQLDGLVLGLSALFSLILTVNTCLCIFGAKYGSLAILIIFANLETLMISMIYGLITDPVRNELNGFNILGMVFLPVILALSFFAERKNKQTEETGKQHQHGWKFLMICILIFFFNGSALPVYSAFSTYRGGVWRIQFYISVSLFLYFVVRSGIGNASMFAKEKGRSRFQCQDVYLYENIALYAHIRGRLSLIGVYHNKNHGDHADCCLSPAEICG